MYVWDKNSDSWGVGRYWVPEPFAERFHYPLVEKNKQTKKQQKKHTKNQNQNLILEQVKDYMNTTFNYVNYAF